MANAEAPILRRLRRRAEERSRLQRLARARVPAEAPRFTQAQPATDEPLPDSVAPPPDLPAEAPVLRAPTDLTAAPPPPAPAALALERDAASDEAAEAGDPVEEIMAAPAMRVPADLTLAAPSGTGLQPGAPGAPALPDWLFAARAILPEPPPRVAAESVGAGTVAGEPGVGDDPDRPLRGHSAAQPAPRRRGWMFALKAAGGALAVLAVLAVVAAGAIVYRLSQGPLSMDIVTERVTSALESQFGEGFDVTVRHADLERTADGILLGVSGIVVRDASGQVVVAAPRAQIGFDATSLMSRRPVPKHIEFLGLAVVLTIAPDGSVSVSADAPEQPTGAAVRPEETQIGGAPTLALGMASFLDLLSSRKGPLAILERAGVRDGRLTINDLRRNVSVQYSNLGLSYSRPQPGENRLKLTAMGPKGQWSLAATVAGMRGAERTLTFTVQDLAVSEILGFAQPGSIPVATDMPISGEARVTLGPDNQIAGVDGKITGGSAVVKIDDPDAKPMAVDHLTGSFGWDPAAHAILVRSLELKAGATLWALGGRAVLPAPGQEFWSVDLASNGSTLAAEGNDKPIVIDAIAVKARVAVGFQSVTVDSITVTGPEVALAANGVAGHGPDIDGIRAQITSGRMPARVLLAFWPHFLAGDVRQWLIDNTASGTIESLDYRTSLNPQQLADVFAKRPLPDDGVHTHFIASQGVMTLMTGLPPLTDLQLEGTITGRTATLSVPKASAQLGTGKPLAFSDGTVRIADMTLKPPVAQVSFKLQGGADGFFDALRSEALKPFVPLSFEPQGIKGQVEAQVGFSLPLGKAIRAQDLVLEAQGSFTGLAIDKLVGKERLEQAGLTFTQDRNGLTLKGDGRLGGMPATIDYRQAPGAPGADAVVSFVADEAARARRGIKLPGLSGPVGVKITAKQGLPAGGKPVLPLVEVDLARAALSDIVPGYSKPAGKPGRASFRLNETPQGVTLEEFTLEAAGGLVAKGSISLSSDGAVQSASLPVLKIGPGGDMKVEAERAGGVLKLTVKATTLDGRSVIKGFTSPGSDSSPGDLDIELKAGTVLGFNGENIGAMDMRAALRGSQIRDLRLAGRLGRAAIAGQSARGENGGPAVVVESGDAGAFLRFADIYRRMQGGRMLLQVGTAGTLEGVLVIDEFTLVDEPALGKAASAPPPSRDGKAQAPPPQPGGAVAFSKLKAPFSMSNGVLTLGETTLSGPTVGGVVQGTIDFNRDQMDLKGTFVPAYGLNNVFNRVPIVGELLGGGKDEGLFAVNFRAGGSFSQPALSINPLSAVAPGFLRKLFGAPRPELTAPPPVPAE
jgi:hypothetical protein